MSITNPAAATAASTGTGTAAVPTAEAELEACSIAALSEDDFRLIAQHASAPDVFSLVVTCKHVFWAAWFEQGKAPLARLLVQDAMRRHLLKLLMNIGAPQLEHLFPDGAEVDEAGRPQVLLSGSIVVQAALGEQWKKSDVDIFCTWEAAPKVRERLIEKGKLVCSGACDTYFFPPDAEDVSQVDHVEGYAALPQPGHHALNSWHSEDELSPDEFLKQAIEHGQEQVDTQGFHSGLPIFDQPKRVGLPGGSTGGRFPYDYRLERETFVQLIIGKEASHDARDLLQSFDLRICQTSFDGAGFHIPQPHETLTGVTRMLPERHKLVSAYLSAELGQAVQAEGGMYEIPDVIEDMGDDVWEGIGLIGYDRKAQEAREAQETARFFQAARSGTAPPRPEPRDAADPSWMVRYEMVQKLIMRMQKYHERGVKILNPPECAGQSALDYDVRFIDRK